MAKIVSIDKNEYIRPNPVRDKTHIQRAYALSWLLDAARGSTTARLHARIIRSMLLTGGLTAPERATCQPVDTRRANAVLRSQTRHVRPTLQSIDHVNRSDELPT
jgi:hypothetical protein